MGAKPPAPPPAGFDKEVAQLLRRVRLLPPRLADVASVVSDVRQALRTRWPESEVTPFGSVMAGLGIVGSDVDCFAQLPEPYSPTLILELQTVLEKFPQTFLQPRAVLAATMPHVRFIHAPTGFQCDVSCQNRWGIRKTALMKYYMELDERVLRLTIIVRYWVKLHKPLNSRRIMPNFAIVSLVIFYLQHVRIVPEVAALQENAHKHMIEQWDTGFDEVPPRSADDVSVYDLLGGFFQYYDKFDFEKMMVSTYAGFPIEKRIFEKVDMLPSLFKLYKRNVAINRITRLNTSAPVLIQDPFLHNMNLAAKTSEDILAQFKCNLKFAAEAYANTKQDFLQVILEENDILRSEVQYLKHNWNNSTIGCCKMCAKNCCLS